MKLFDLVRRAVSRTEAVVEQAVVAVVGDRYSRFNRNPAWGDAKINRGDAIVGRQIVAPDVQLGPQWEKFGEWDEWDSFWKPGR